MSNRPQSWWAAGQTWLCEKANAHFSAWAQSRDGRRWRKSFGRKSPYHCGYVQPEWIREATGALGHNDEELFKYLKLANL